MMAPTSLDVVRLQLAAREPELRRYGVRHLAVEIEDGHSFSLIRMEETRLFHADALCRAVDLG